MGRSSSSSPERGHARDKKKKKSKEKEKDKDKDRDRRRDKDRDKPRHDVGRDRPDRDLDRGHERHVEKDRDRDRDRDRLDRDRDRDRHRSGRPRSRSRSAERGHKRHRHAAEGAGGSRDGGADGAGGSTAVKALSREEAAKKAREDEQASLDAQMEERRRRVEEWRRKKMEGQEGSAAGTSTQDDVTMAGQAEDGVGAAPEGNGQKGWSLEDDDDDDGLGAANGVDEDDHPDGMDVEEEERPVPPALASVTAADEDDEVDPLDAFMMDNDTKLSKQLRQQQQQQQQQAAAAEEDGDVDPLDAFMAAQVLPKVKAELTAAGPSAAAAAAAAAPAAGAAAPSGGVKMEADTQPSSQAAKGQLAGAAARRGGAAGRGGGAAARGRGGRGRAARWGGSSDESSSDYGEEEASSEEDDAEWTRQVNAGKLSKGDRMGVVDHSAVDYPPFRKNFYIEVPELARLSEAEVAEIRKEDGIKVRGKDYPKPIRAWTQAGLSGKLLDLLKKSGFQAPLAIQAQALPIIMSGRDCIGIAKTGSGKTLAFVLPMMRHIKDQPPIAQGDGPIGLLMAPTRELVQQICKVGRSDDKEIKKFGKPLGLGCVAVFGGSGVANQITELKRGTEMVVCTPGRMIDLLTTSNGKITNLRRVTYFVLDEADRMFDMGFEPQIMRIVQNIRPDRQTVMFSATFPRQVETLARKILSDPVEIQVGGRSVVNPDIEQIIEIRPESERFLRLLEVLGEWYGKGKMIIFVQSQDKCDSLFRDLLNYGYPCLSLHGGKDQSDREGTVSDFKGDVCNILVATSVAARGLDVKDLVLVLNYDAPNHHEDYVHRVGRTGRAGNKGTAITFIGPDEEQYAPDLVKALKDSGAPVPDDLQALASSFADKRKQGLVQGHGSGFGGSGHKFDKSEEDQYKQARKAKAKELGLTGAEEEEEEEDDGGGVRRVDPSAPQPATVTAPKPGEAGSTTIGGATISAEAMAAMAKAAAAAGAAAPAAPSALQAANPAAQAQILAAQAVAARLVSGGVGVPSAAGTMLPPPPVSSVNSAMLAAMAAIPGVTLAPTALAGGSAGMSGLSMLGAAQRAAQLAAALSGVPGKDPTAPHYEAELEINDFPQHSRWKVTHRETIQSVAELTGAAVITKGVFVPPGKPVPEGERKIYLLIEGPTEATVKRAKQELKRVLEETTEKVMRRDAPAAGRYTV